MYIILWLLLSITNYFYYFHKLTLFFFPTQIEREFEEGLQKSSNRNSKIAGFKEQQKENDDGGSMSQTTDSSESEMSDAAVTNIDPCQLEKKMLSLWERIAKLEKHCKE